MTLDLSPSDGADRGTRALSFWKLDDLDDDMLNKYSDRMQLLNILGSWSEEKLGTDNRFDFNISKADGYKLDLDLEPGFYYMRDVTRPRGEYWLVDNIIVIGEDAPPLVKVKWTKDIIPPPPETPPGEILLYKTDDRGNPLAGVVFNLYDENGNPVRTKNYVYDPAGEVEDLVTDENGYIRVTNLPKGTYKFVEVRTLPGYEIERGSNYVRVDYDTGGFVHVVNKRLRGELKFKKVDSDSGQPLEGAVFSIYRRIDGKKVFLKDKNGDILYARSDEKGYFSFNDLDFGYHYVVEVEAPEGYVLPPNEYHEYVVNSESYKFVNEIGNDRIEIEIEKKKEDEKIVKVGDVTLIVMFIAGAIFVLIGRFLIKSEESK